MRAARPGKGLASREGRANGRLSTKPARGRAGKARSTPEQAGTGWGRGPKGGIGLERSETGERDHPTTDGNEEEPKEERGKGTRP